MNIALAPAMSITLDTPVVPAVTDTISAYACGAIWLEIGEP